MENFSFTINYVSAGQPKDKPATLIPSPDGIERWYNVTETISYPILNNEIQVPPRDYILFQNWTNIQPVNGKFILPTNYTELQIAQQVKAKQIRFLEQEIRDLRRSVQIAEAQIQQRRERLEVIRSQTHAATYPTS